MSFWLNLFLIILAGMLGGMLVNYLADVLPLYRTILAPRCAQCNAEFPLSNYLLYPRVCPSCHHKRTKRTWIVEATTMLGSLWIFEGYQGSFPPTGAFILFCFFVLVMIIDIEHRLIMHGVSIFGAAMGFVLGSDAHGLKSTIIGGVGGFTIMFLFYLAGFLFVKFLRRARGIQLEEDALGFGDVNLSGVIGLVMGWPGVLAALLLAILLGGLVSLVYLIYRLATKRFTHMESLAYGPFLSIGALLLILFKDVFL